MIKSKLNTPLKTAEGLGSAHSGVHHWLALRISSVALVPLTIWFVVSVIRLSQSDQAQLMQFFHSPFNALIMGLVVGFSFYHGALGLREVVEDYVHRKFSKTVVILLINFGFLLLGALTLMAVAKLHFFA